MNNTRKITISIDIEQVLKTVYAESACLALMSSRDSRPAVISSDNRRLLGVYCLNAWVCLAMQFRDNAARTLSGLRLAATLSDRVDCWL